MCLCVYERSQGCGRCRKRTFQTARANSTKGIGAVTSENTGERNKQYSTCDVFCYGRDHVLWDLNWLAANVGRDGL